MAISKQASFGLGGWWFGVVGGFAEVRGPAACLRRDALFRRLLLVADVVAIVGAFLLTVGLSSRSVQLTWAGVAAVPILVVGAKLTGLYDRDETLLRKTTLDEAPRLFQLATLCSLVAWLTGGLLIHGALDRHEALFLWLALSGGLIVGAGGGAERWRCGWRRRSGVCSSGMSFRRRRFARSLGMAG